MRLKKFSFLVCCVAVAFPFVGHCAFYSANAQSFPQITGWTFSRSYGRGAGNSSAATAISESNGSEFFLRDNVKSTSVLDPDGTFEVLDPAKPFSLGVRARKAEEVVVEQQLNYFSLSDWGYTVFSN